jgi:sulfur relay (sulfurtransferase) DsrC/TusE family protein
MPRPKKKDPKEWTTEEAMERLFPKKVRDKAKKVAGEPKKPQVKRSK